MSAYSRAFASFTSGQPLDDTAAVALLGELRMEFGQELAAAVEQAVEAQYRPAEADSSSAVRVKRHKLGAAIRTVNLVRQFATNPRGFTPPTQRDPRSTS